MKIGEFVAASVRNGDHMIDLKRLGLSAGFAGAVALCEQTFNVSSFQFVVDKFVASASVVLRSARMGFGALRIFDSPCEVSSLEFIRVFSSTLILIVALFLTVGNVVFSHDLLDTFAIAGAPVFMSGGHSFWMPLSISLTCFGLLRVPFVAIQRFSFPGLNQNSISVFCDMFTNSCASASEAMPGFGSSSVDMSIGARNASKVVVETLNEGLFSGYGVGHIRPLLVGAQ